jgi:thiamine phosphate synthase YjbQ (UPF0047 family)
MAVHTGLLRLSTPARASSTGRSRARPPTSPGLRHPRDSDHDASAHAYLRAAVIGPCESVSVVGGELRRGTWQPVILVDLEDRPRDRVVSVSFLC